MTDPAPITAACLCAGGCERDAEGGGLLCWSCQQDGCEAQPSAPRLPRDPLLVDPPFAAVEALAERLKEVIHDRAATWETQFDAGPGQVVSVSDAAWVIARWLLT